MRRKLCTHLLFWQFCGDRRCKRARACAGDVEACFKVFWPAVPEELKNQIRQTVIFLKDGMTPREASAAAAEYVEQRMRIAEANAAREAAEREAPPPEPEPAPIKVTRAHPPVRFAGPRIRGM